MTTDRRRLVVIGGGVAGATAARAARGEYPDAEITLFSKEPVAFYNKIALNSVVTGKRRAEELRVLAPDWLEDQGVECRWGEGVRAVELDRRRVLLEGGGEVDFDRLILATGASPVRPPVPGIDGAGVLPLWSLEDALALRERVSGARRLLVIGGGVLGVEIALDLTALVGEVTLVEARSELMPGLLDREASALLAEALTDRGVKVLTDAAVGAVDPGAGGCRVRLARGEPLEVDLAVLVAGVAPRVALAEAAGLETRRGVVVDELMRTSHPLVLAAGNCVELGPELRFLWNPARSQGEVAGINAFDPRRSVPPQPPSLHAKTPGLPIFVCGRSARSEPGDEVLRSREGQGYRALRFDRGGRLVGAICLGDVDGYYALERAITRGEVPSAELRASRQVAPLVEALKPPSAPEDHLKPNWVCQMCGYNAEGEHPPEICPVCGVGRDQFLVA